MFSVEFVCKYFATRAAAMSAADSPAATVSALAATVVSVDSELPPHAVSASKPVTANARPRRNLIEFVINYPLYSIDWY